MDTVERSSSSTVKLFIESIHEQKIDYAASLLSENCVFRNVGFESTISGRNNIGEYLTSLIQSVPDYRFQEESMTFGDDTVVICGRILGTIESDALGMGLSSGRKIDIEAVNAFVLRDGLIQSCTGYFCTASLCDQAGMRLTNLRPTDGSRFIPLYDAFWHMEEKDIAQVPNNITDDILAHWPGPGGAGSGKAHYMGQIYRLLNAVPDIQVDIIDYIAEGDRVFIEFHAHGTGPTGEAVSFNGIDRFHVRGAQVYDSKVMFDPAPVLNATLLAAQQWPGA